MKKVLAATMLACATCFAQSVVPRIEIDGHAYTNATIRKVNPKTVIVRDEGGFGTFAITSLPEPYRSKFLDSHEIEEADRIAAKARMEGKQRELAIAQQKFRRDFVLIGSNPVAKAAIPENRGTVLYSWQGGAVIKYFDTSDDNNPFSEEKYIFVKGITNAVDDAHVSFRAVKTSLRTKIGTRIYETWDCGKPLP